MLPDSLGERFHHPIHFTLLWRQFFTHFVLYPGLLSDPDSFPTKVDCLNGRQARNNLRRTGGIQQDKTGLIVEFRPYPLATVG
jgi:hypothetical protein